MRGRLRVRVNPEQMHPQNGDPQSSDLYTAFPDYFAINPTPVKLNNTNGSAKTLFIDFYFPLFFPYTYRIRPSTNASRLRNDL
jgi:hypothetical protein